MIEVKNEVEYNNPFHTIWGNVPDLVWDFYYAKFSEAVAERKMGFSQAQSFRHTMTSYASGQRRFKAMYRMDCRLREIVCEVFPIANDSILFTGEVEEMTMEAEKVALRMIMDFQELFETQSKDLPRT